MKKRPRRRIQIPPSELIWLVSGMGMHFEDELHDQLRETLSSLRRDLVHLDRSERAARASFYLALALEAGIASAEGNVYHAIEDLQFTVQDTLRELAAKRSIPYSSYLETLHWFVKREEALARAGNHCELCNSPHGLQVHHKTYERLWEEEPGDLIVLCRRCHAKFHDKLP